MRQKPIKSVVPMVVCEAPGCSQQFPLNKAFGIKQHIACADAPIAAVDCSAEMHYGCTLAHAKAAADQCYTEHLLPAYQQARERAFIQGAARSDSSQAVSGSDSPQ